MLETTRQVEIDGIEPAAPEAPGPYTVSWATGPARWSKSFRSLAQAASFEAELHAADSRGEQFYLLNGRPASWGKPLIAKSWYDFCVSYVDMKWEDSAAKSRASTAWSLITIMPAMIKDGTAVPYDSKDIRSALRQWGFNTKQRPHCPEWAAEILAWLSASTRPVSALTSPDVLRAAVDAAASQAASRKRATAVVASSNRSVLSLALDYAVEQDLLESNPLAGGKHKTKKVPVAVDWRCVVNPVQASALLDAVAGWQLSGPRLVAYFGSLYYCGLRPEEAYDLRTENIFLPPRVWDEAAGCWRERGPGFGQLRIRSAAPHSGWEWTDGGTIRDQRPLKARQPGEMRVIPVPAQLARLLRAHLERFPARPDGRIFSGVMGGELNANSIGLAWAAARKRALTPAEYDSPLARRPYDLRHACVSTWLNNGVAPQQVAEWAGHSVPVLLSVYAKCLAGQGEIALQRVEDALARRSDPEDSWPVVPWQPESSGLLPADQEYPAGSGSAGAK